ncbi:protein kinase domain-containing protein [Actinophytocola algeriensis]|uniref:Outer membrane protein assembly factor BamB/predicted Ser/Thr protein kinase n=1 Tax=Actinophytocola algeriensis TaxID=1768010 RepID=A0A7W7VDM7_9PSEU|nr:serine/threonine-protein kinase [Actinophytocola algeriensis]MBB4906150.1 outer membrane protein assembly factor BamB/predicted Ser/Thr protein kinase [Actinophytocola algeriensis]MBE1472165.1 outer membrane protein assembly factor BamB/predicted Ser/Thr protein kinase [Actinophytocola algeriensis]
MEGLRRDDPDRIGGYVLLGRLGEGGMGVVYLGRSAGGRTVAVKVIRERFAADPRYRARFRREASAAAQLTSTVTAPVLDADPDAAAPWLVTAYLVGVTVHEAVGVHGPLPPGAARVVAAGLGEALVEIHSIGMAHRDVKPGNVMLTADGPRLIDFGIARPFDATAITVVGTTVGTPGYMAPEQAQGEPASPASDVFSAGAVLAYAATGRAPFGTGDTAMILARADRVQADLAGIADRHLLDVITACLARDPAARPSAGTLAHLAAPGGPDWLPAAVREEIDRRATTDPAALPAPLPTPGMADVTVDPVVTRPAQPRRRTLLVAGGATAAAAVVAAGLTLFRDRDEPTAAPPKKTTTEPTTTTSTPPPIAVPLWSTKVSDYYPDVFTVGGVVVAISQEDRVHAIDPATGKVLWTTPSTLLGEVAGGHVYAAENTNPVLRAFDPRTGAIRWSYTPPFREVIVRLTETGSVASFGWESLRARAATNGAGLWTAAVDAQNGLAAGGELIVAASGTALTGLAAASGQTRWTYPVDEPFYLAVGERAVYATDRNGVLHAIAAAGGTALWRVPSMMPASAPVPVGDVLYLGGGRGEVIALAAATGTRTWAREYGADCVVGHVDGVLQVSTGSEVHVLDAADGTTRWTYESDVNPKTPPCAVGGVVYVGTREGAVVALAPPGGARAGS